MKAQHFCIIFLVFASCTKPSYVPRDLTQSFEYLDANLSNEDISELKSKTEKGQPPYYHELEIQQTIKNKLSENTNTWETTNHFFDSLDIYNVNDKSGLIINMYTDYLNNIDINIDKEISIVESYRLPIALCQLKLDKKASTYYNMFQINDEIIIQIPVDEHENGVAYSCPQIDWKFIRNTDLELIAVITEKRNFKTLSSSYFKVKISSKSHKFTTILSEELFKGDELKVPYYTTWKLKPKS